MGSSADLPAAHGGSRPSHETGPVLATVDAAGSDCRLDAYLPKRFPEHSRAVFQKWIDEGRVLHNGGAAKGKSRLRPGDRLTIDFPPPPSTALIGEKLDLSVLYEDEDLIAIDKSSGMAVHPGAGIREGTVVHALLGRGGCLSDLRGDDRPGIIHRLDKDTSGVLLLAKNNQAHEAVARQFRERRLKKVYWALVSGRPAREGCVDAPIGRSREHRKKMAVIEDGKPSKTDFRVMEAVDRFAFLELRLHTGRTHQIRVHMAHLGHPVLCDELYSRKGVLKFRDLGGAFERSSQSETAICERLSLHARLLELQHPKSGVALRLVAPWPEALARAWETIQAHTAPRP